MADKKKEIKMDTVDGNFAAAHVAYALSDVGMIYPITPSSPMAELAEAWSGQGRKNCYDQKVLIQMMQSEAGAAGALHGALSAGSLATTFTASQGLLLMIPNMIKIAGEIMPCVIHVAARALAGQALSIFGDHSDVMACRGTGWAMLSSGSVQECSDLGIVAHLASMASSLPFMHFFEGFRLSHELNKVQIIDYDDIKKLVDLEDVKRHQDRALNPMHPHLRGSAQGPDMFFQMVEVANKYYQAIPEIVLKKMKAVESITGRKYQLFDYLGHEQADRIIICMGSSYPIVNEAVQYLMKQGEKVGVIIVRLYRPWSPKHMFQVLPKTVKKIAVLDRVKESGALGEPLFMDVSASILEAGMNITVIGGRFGLGSKDFTPAMAKAVFDNLALNEPKRHFTVGINDDVTNTSLAVGPPISAIAKGTIQCLFWGMGSDGTVGANKDSIKIIGDNTDLYAQAYFAYDAKKSGGVTVSHLRFGPEPILSSYAVREADFIAVHKDNYLDRYPVLAAAKEGTIFLLNTALTGDKLEEHIPGFLKNIIAAKKMKFYYINAIDVTSKIGLGKRINLVMQSCFFKLANVMPYDTAVPLMKAAVVKTFGKKGPEIVRMNHEAIDAALGHLKQYDYDAAKWLNISAGKRHTVPDDAPQFVRDVIDPIIHMEGDDLPVSVMNTAGIQPVGTTKYEKRAIASIVPAWNEEKCTECNYCSLICPHAAIRPFVAAETEVESAPDAYVVRRSKGIETAGMLYRIQVSPQDCTGCQLCVSVCPDDALKMVPFTDDLVRIESNNFNFAVNLPTRGHLFERSTVKGSQFQQPLLEFSGACEGCGETPYVKLITQLFGERMVIANATGCSSIWGGSAPTTPYTTNADGRGPAWANSLFEDNAEYGTGMVLSFLHRRNKLADRIEAVVQKGLCTPELKDLFESWIKYRRDANKCEAIIAKLLPLLTLERKNSEDLMEIYLMRDMLPKISNWIIGGDGWAYDIGYGGLDHIMSMGEDVNVLVMDTEVYSNTGGQASKATPLGSVAKFAATGRRRNKKNLGLRGMSYEDVYVASIALDADMSQCVKAISEAEAYPGTSLLVGYAPCGEHGIKGGLKDAVDEVKLAVETGYWDLYRYNPLLESEGKNPFILDSKKLRKELSEFLARENRYSRLSRAMPEVASALHDDLQSFVTRRHEKWEQMAAGYDKLAQGIGAAPDMTILYGTETGNAEDVARRIAADATSRTLNAKVMELDEMEVDLLKESGSILIVTSTAGQGEVPKTAKNFVKELDNSSLANDALEGVRYAVFGLGDSSYVFFNAVAKNIDSRLAQVGATRILPVGLGDDRDAEKFETKLEDFMPEFWTAISAPEPAGGYPAPTYEVKATDTQPAAYIPYGATQLPLVKHEILEKTRDIVHYVFDLKGTGFKYSLGDSLGIFPHNDPKLVEDFLKLYGLAGDDVIEIKSVDAKPAHKQLPSVVSVRQLFTEVLDIFGRPARAFYKAMAHFAKDEAEKAELAGFMTAEGKDAFVKMVGDDMPTYADLLAQYKSVRPSLAELLDIVTPIKARYYSIASSQKAKPNELELCIVLVDWETKKYGKREGVCTGFLKRVRGGKVVLNCMRNPGAIVLPAKPTTPIMMAGLGTGMAPYHAIVQDTWHQKKQGKPYGPLCLFYGARNKATDFLYGNWLEEAQKDGVLTHLKTAWSRDQEYKIYVQDKIVEDPKLVWDYLVEQKGFFFYCGSAGRAPAQCRAAICEALSKAGDISLEQADDIVLTMQKAGRYIVEAW